MDEEVKQLNNLIASIDQARLKLDVDKDEAQLVQFEAQMQRPHFWDQPEEAARVSAQAASLKRHVDEWDGLLSRARDTLELAKMNDASMISDIKNSLQQLQQEYEAKEFELKMSGEYDRTGAIISVYAGTGGTDAQDWAQMLMRMYLRYAEQHGFSAQVLDESAGEEAGIKSATIEITGPYAYGRLKGEKGVHRLVRLSPYNSDNLRQTSFALVEVLPQLDAQSRVEVDPKDLRIDVYRSGGRGGQSVNTTDSAVRITHLPTGTVVAIQNERSQLQNKEKALAILRAKLQVLMEEQHKEQLSELKGPTNDSQWGHQIRSYVLHPYTKVKDHRTNFETSQASDVLDGNLDGFIEAYLLSQISK